MPSSSLIARMAGQGEIRRDSRSGFTEKLALSRKSRMTAKPPATIKSEDVMEYVPYLLTAYAIFAMAVMSPGPNFLAVTSASITVSRRAGLGIALGIGTGTICWSTMTVLGLTAILAASEEVAIALRWIGGGYLIYMGLMSLRSAYKSRGQGLEVPVSDAKADRPLWRYVRRGLLVQMSNPKAALFWFSIMSIVLRPDAPGWVGLAIVLGTTTFSFGWHLVLAWFFSTEAVMRVYRRAYRAIQGVMGTAFVLLGGRLIAN
ncbi:LysE family transporter [Thalassospiraceae bacterium SW-3-3]|nr:LysE family transporter [Thalassospiraceae bacterium SW-3-3]